MPEKGQKKLTELGEYRKLRKWQIFGTNIHTPSSIKPKIFS
jgi:hypothetical protein